MQLIRSIVASTASLSLLSRRSSSTNSPLYRSLSFFLPGHINSFSNAPSSMSRSTNSPSPPLGDPSSWPAPLENDTTGPAVLSSSRVLLPAELRAQRLRALGQAVAPGLRAASAISRDEIEAHLLNKIDRPNDKKQPKPKDNKSEVIDLVDSSDDEQHHQQQQKVYERAKKAVPKGSTSRQRQWNSKTIELLDDDDESSTAPSNEDKSKQENPKCAVPISKIENPYSRKRKASVAPSASGTSSRGGLKIPIDASTAMKTPATTTTLANFQVATWNVWFGPDGDGNPHPGPRMRALCRILQEQQHDDNAPSSGPLWFIGFQEVIDPLASYLTASLQPNYHFYRQTGASYGCAMAVHKQLRVLEQGWIPYQPTAMSRGFLYVRVATTTDQQILFTTTHLESYAGPQYTGAAQRIVQLQQMEAFCNQQMDGRHGNKLCVAIMSGDCNWDDERRGNANDPKLSSVLTRRADWQDSWLSTQQSSTKTDTCYTYDGQRNPMLNNKLRRRFDRILLRSQSPTSQTKTKAVRAVSTTLLGTQALPDLTWDKYNPWQRTHKTMPTAPSDHFGYLVRMQQSG